MANEDIPDELRAQAVALPNLGQESTEPLPASLREWLKGPSIVGLGEATHGTRECFALKNRLIKHLVRDVGFRTVAFEADAAATTALDEYVRTGKGDPAAALAKLNMWQWRTEMVRDLLAWLREFNAGRSAEDNVRVRGIDLSVPSAPVAPLRAYLEPVDPALADGDAIATLANAEIPDDDVEREQALDDLAGAVDTVKERFDGNRAEYVAESTQRAWSDARHFCRVIEQACEWHRVRHEHEGPHPDGMAARDRFMAENVGWALAEDRGSGVAVWAHDAHIQRGTFDDGTRWRDATTMGERLDREFGAEYRPLGLDFGRGSFRAVNAQNGGVETFTVGKPLWGSATEQFARLDGSCFVSFTDPGTSWPETEQPRRYVGSVYDPTADETVGNGYARTNLPASFDGLVFVESSSPTRPIGDG